VITSWTPTPVQKLVTIRPGVSSPRMRDFAHQKRVSCLGFFGFLQLATAKGPGRILTQNTPKHALPPKDVPFRGCEHNRPILMKFGTLQQMVNQIAVSWSKIEIFKIQDGGGRHLENRFCGHNSSTIFQLRRNFVWRSWMASRQRPHDKNCKLLNSKMADGRHFENR